MHINQQRLNTNLQFDTIVTVLKLGKLLKPVGLYNGRCIITRQNVFTWKIS